MTMRYLIVGLAILIAVSTSGAIAQQDIGPDDVFIEFFGEQSCAANSAFQNYTYADTSFSTLLAGEPIIIVAAAGEYDSIEEAMRAVDELPAFVEDALATSPPQEISTPTLGDAFSAYVMDVQAHDTAEGLPISDFRLSLGIVRKEATVAAILTVGTTGAVGTLTEIFEAFDDQWPSALAPRSESIDEVSGGIFEARPELDDMPTGYIEETGGVIVRRLSCLDS